MASIFVQPLPFTVVSGNAITNLPLSNLNSDKPMPWRSADLTTVYMIVDLTTSASYDTVALVGSNLRSSDTVRIRTGATVSGTGSYDSGTFAAFEGVKGKTVSTKTIHVIGEVRTDRYMRIDITSVANPAGYVTAQRLVVGEAISMGGIDSDAEMSFEDQSVINTGPNYFARHKLPTLTKWKVTMSWTDNTTFNERWTPFFLEVGLGDGFLFVPRLEAPELWQHESIYCRVSGQPAKGKAIAYDLWTLDLQLMAVAA